MEFRRGHRDERRRRVLLEEPVVEESEGGSTPTRRRATDASAADSTPRYSEAALSPQQPRVIDLIPSRWWTNFVLVGLLLSVAVGIETLYGYVALGYTSLTISQLPAIDLSVRGSVATWFSSLLLGTCALYGLLIYQIRRYRVDDYRGRYRMWCWVVPLFMLASVDQVAGLQNSVRTVLLHSAGIPDYPDAMLVWVGAVAVICGIVGLRLIIEMRGSRLSCLLLVVAFACLAALASAQVEWMVMQPGILQTMTFSALALGAHVALLTAFLLYARHIYRDAQGRVTARRKQQRSRSKQRRRKEKSETEEGSETPEPRSRTRRKGGKVTRTDPAHTPPSSAKDQDGGKSTRSNRTSSSSASSNRAGRKEKRRVAADASKAKNTADPNLCEPDNDQLEQPRKMSKAERKRIRKQRRRQQ